MTIGLHKNDEVFDAQIQDGQLTPYALNNPSNAKPFVSGPVTFYFGPETFQEDVVANYLTLLANRTSVLIANKEKFGWNVIGSIPEPPYTIVSQPSSNEQAEVSTNTDASNPLLAAIRTESGWTMNIFGKKDSDGSPTTMNYACLQLPSQQVVTILFDEEKRPIQLSNGENSIIAVDWNAKTFSAMNGRLSCPQAITQPDAKMSKAMLLANFASAAECKSFKHEIQISAAACGYFALVARRIGGFALVTGVGASFGTGAILAGNIAAGAGVVLGFFQAFIDCDDLPTGEPDDEDLPTPAPTEQPQPTPSPAPTAQPTPSPAPTAQPTPTPQPTPTATPSPTPTPTPTPTPSCPKAIKALCTKWRGQYYGDAACWCNLNTAPLCTEDAFLNECNSIPGTDSGCAGGIHYCKKG